MERPRLDLVALTACVLALVMLGTYLAIMREQHEDPAVFAVVALAVGAAGAAYGAVRSTRLRRVSLGVAGLVLGLLGLLAILSIGLPILLAAALCGAAALRQPQHQPAGRLNH